MPIDRSKTPYERWAVEEEIPIIRGYSVDDLRAVPVGPWARKGALGALINLEGGEGFIGAYVCEIPAKSSVKPQRHLFEEQIYVLEGRGVTEVWMHDFRQTVEWQKGSVFSVPLNSWHQHYSSGDGTARYLSVMAAPLALNWFRDPDFVFDCEHVFRSRVPENTSGYYSSTGEMVGHEWWINLIPDVATVELPPAQPGAGGYTAQLFRQCENTMLNHIGVIPPGIYKKAHVHWPGAHLIVVQGSGYTLMWPAWPPGSKKVRVDWKVGSMFSPPGDWFHQHFNTGPEPVRLLALRKGNDGVGKMYDTMVAMKYGGTQIEYEAEEPEIREIYEDELKKKGLARIYY